MGIISAKIPEQSSGYNVSITTVTTIEKYNKYNHIFHNINVLWTYMHTYKALVSLLSS